jgi:predicted AlkP superfamily pyrophosphatase or phosphodiesterase
VDVLQRTGRSRNATLIIVSDHGFRTYKFKIQANVLLREKGLLSSAPGQSKVEAWVMPEGGIAMLYVNPARKAELVRELRRMFTGVEGVEAVYGVEDFTKLGLPTPAQSDQAPDLVLAARPDYMFGNESEGAFITHAPSAGTHGYINTDPLMQAIFIAWGAGIPRGIQLGDISNLDVAPTVAALLGFEMKGLKGHAIKQILRGDCSTP